VIAIVLIVGAANAVFAARLVSAARTQQMTICGEQKDIGNLAAIKVTVNPATHKAAKLGIAIIADSRLAWAGLGCPGRLNKPGRSFLRWAAYYDISYR